MTTTTTTKKLTKRDYFNALYTHFQETGRDCGTISADNMMEFLEREIELLEKKNANKKPTAQQSANEGIKEAILEGLVERMTITEMQKSIPELAELSNQRISALVRQMVDAGIIIRTEDKRKAYFSKA
jgi:DNA-binding transcriptional regulator GbsR (MarR family)